jgi:hypothetical protein
MGAKATKIIYWIATLLIAGFTLPGFFYMDSELAIEGMNHVGLTNAVRLQQVVGYGAPLAILAILLLPKPRNRLKEWAYAGLAFVYIGAFWAHVQLGDTLAEIAMPLVTLVVLMVSYFMWHKLISGKAVEAK